MLQWRQGERGREYIKKGFPVERPVILTLEWEFGGFGVLGALKIGINMNCQV